VRNASYIAIVCGVLLAVPGCGRGGKVAAPNPESDNFKDAQYYQSLMGINSVTSYGNFLHGLGPADRVKYINKSVEDGPPTRIFALKAAYERFLNDSNAEVAAAAKEALSKVPSAEELEAARKEELESLKPKQ
jgi:hypothetical protein